MGVPISGKMLKDLRGQKRLSQLALAERSKVGIATIKRIENSPDIYSANKNSASRLAKALEMEISDLSEGNFSRIVDMGEDLEFRVDRYNNPDRFRESNEQLIKIIEFRNRILSELSDETS